MKFWNNVKEICGESKNELSDIRVREPKSGNLCEPAHTADLINNFFTSIGPKLGDKIAPTLDPGTLMESEFLSQPINPITPEKILKFPDDFSELKSSGCLYLNSRCYIAAFKTLPIQLSFIFNLSLSTAIIPDKWIRGLGTPIRKKGDITAIDNWRPISITHICSKILEMHASSFIESYLKETTTITDQQMGFRKGLSTSDAIADMVIGLNKNMNAGL